MEVERLSGLQVLQEDNLPHDAKSLSTRFVRTLREKKDKQGNAIWLRRSRLVAREYTWLQPDRDALFSPATSNIASRILPLCFLALREHQDTMMLAIDVKDAFLTVKREQPTRVRCTDASGRSVSYSLGRVLPGRRDGSLLWHRDLVKFAGESSLGMVEFEAYPSILRSKLGDCLLMIHVDEIFVRWVTQSSHRRADPTYAVKVWSFHRDHVQCRWRVDLSQAHPPAFGMGAWWWRSMGNIWINFASCCNSQSACRTRSHLDTLRLKFLTSQRSWVLMMDQFIVHAWGFCFFFHLTFHNVSMWLDTFRRSLQSQHRKQWLCWSTWWDIWLAMQTNMFLSDGREFTLEYSKTMSVMSRCWKCSVMQIGHQTATLDVQCQELPFSLEVVWFTPPVEHRRLCHFPAQSQKRMQPPAQWWMQSSSEPSFHGCFSQQFSCVCTLTHQRHVEFLSRRGVGRLRHLSCRVLWLQNLVGERLLMVKAVLGAINPSDIATKRLSISRLESQLYLFGIWDSANNSLVGQHDPGRIFRNVPQPQQNSASRYQINMLIGALSLLLHGCGSDVPSGAMDSNFQGSTMQATIVTSWITLLTLYMVFLWMSNDQSVHNEVLASSDDDGLTLWKLQRDRFQLWRSSRLSRF